MVRKQKTDDGIPQVIVTGQEQPGDERSMSREGTYSREPSRERSSRSVSISRLRVDDPLRKEMMLVREKSPFEIGENRNVQVASCKAIIDKALVMDVSGGVTNVDEYISLFFSSGCVIDEASCKDISTAVEVTIIEEEEERPELVVMPLVEEEPPVVEDGADAHDVEATEPDAADAFEGATDQQGDEAIEGETAEPGEPEPLPEAPAEPKDDESDLKADSDESGESYSETEESSSELSYSYSDMSVDEVDPSEWRVFH
uniref:Uncharacterized protein n=1 Tax=Anopheles maculatus TaxID=74869 RepID=A0A182SI97_9DIPT